MVFGDEDGYGSQESGCCRFPSPSGGRVAARSRKKQQGLWRRRQSAKPLSHSQLRRVRRYQQHQAFAAALQGSVPGLASEGEQPSSAVSAVAGSSWHKRAKALLCCCLLLCVVPALAVPEALTGLPFLTNNLALWELSRGAGYRFRGTNCLDAAPNISASSRQWSQAEGRSGAGSGCSWQLPFLSWSG
jgi:hypothetical protein